MRATTAILCAALAVLVGSLSPAPALAQSVKGTGVLRADHGAVDGTNLFVTVAVNAYIDGNGNPRGTVSYLGNVPNTLPHGNVGPGGPADPYVLGVTDLIVEGNVAYVRGIVIASPAGTGNANGQEVDFVFTDNSGTGEPDELFVTGFSQAFPLNAGNYTVRD